MAKIKLIYIDGSDSAADYFCGEYLEKYAKEDEYVFPILFGELGWRESKRLFLEKKETVEVEKLVVITNDVTLLNHISIEVSIEDYELWLWGWNRELKNILDIYPNLRKINNLMKMYMAGMFEEITDETK